MKNLDNEMIMVYIFMLRNKIRVFFFSLDTPSNIKSERHLGSPQDAHCICEFPQCMKMATANIPNSKTMLVM